MKGFPSAPSTTVKMNFNGLSRFAAALPALLQTRVDQAAAAFREALTDAIASGRYDLRTDTGTMIESIYISSPHGSDYDERLKAALAAYLGNPSIWRDLVQAYVAPGAYSAEHFAERANEEEPLPELSQGEAIAAVSMFWAIGFLFEFGHQNQLTGNYEHRPFMGPEADLFGAAQYQSFFFDITRDFVL